MVTRVDKIETFAVYKPETVEEMIEFGKMLITYNARTHGDYSDTFVVITGYVFFDHHSNEHKICYETPDGMRYVVVDEFDLTWRITEMKEIVG